MRGKVQLSDNGWKTTTHDPFDIIPVFYLNSCFNYSGMWKKSLVAE
jgi:hypothetical protein